MLQIAENIQTNNPQSLAGRGFCRKFEVTTNQNTTMTNLHSPSEIFKPIIGYEGLYEVSNLGRVRSLERYVMKKNGRFKVNTYYNEKILRFLLRAGYHRVCLHKDGIGKRINVHFLVATAFLENPDPLNKTVINHKDGDKSNNRYDNLEWCTPSENSLHSYRVLGRTRFWEGMKKEKCSWSKPVVQLTKSGEEVRRYVSMSETQEYGFSVSSVSNCVLGRLKTHRGFIWKRA